MEYRNPTPTVDVIVYRRIQNVQCLKYYSFERLNPLMVGHCQGGFVDEWEMVETAAIREVKEETGLKIILDELFYVYSNPTRDNRQHTLSIVFTAEVSANRDVIPP